MRRPKPSLRNSSDREVAPGAFRLMRTARSRAATFMAATSLGAVVLIAAVALLVGQAMGAITKSDAHLRAAHGVDLLVTVGARLPKLGRASIADTLSPSGIRRLDSAVNSGQHDRLLANLAGFR